MVFQLTRELENNGGLELSRRDYCCVYDSYIVMYIPVGYYMTREEETELIGTKISRSADAVRRHQPCT